MMRKILVALMTAMFAAGLMGCEQKGPAEGAGDKIDEAVEKAGERLEGAGETVQKEAGN
jgi:predicted small lipoprotein YifL